VKIATHRHIVFYVFSLALLTWLPVFHPTFILVVSPITISFTCFSAYTQFLGISLNQSTLVGSCRHFKSPHSFYLIISLLVHNLSLYLSFISSSCEAIIIIIIFMVHHGGIKDRRNWRSLDTTDHCPI